METKTTEFKPGMQVAYVEKYQGKVVRIICLATIKTVGKRDIKLTNSEHARYKTDGQSWDSLYYNRWIMPLTPELLAKAETNNAFDCRTSVSK